MAMQSPFFAFVGRLLFGFLFLSSGLQKLQTFDIKTGGPVMQHMAPKVTHALTVMDDLLKKTAAKYELPMNYAILEKYSLKPEHYPFLLGLAIFLEVAGSLLFVLDKAIGAQMLILFTVPVTLVMHNFWDLPARSPEQFTDMIMFFKNFALVGGLIMYLGMRPKKSGPVRIPASE